MLILNVRYMEYYYETNHTETSNIFFLNKYLPTMYIYVKYIQNIIVFARYLNKMYHLVANCLNNLLN